MKKLKRNSDSINIDQNILDRCKSLIIDTRDFYCSVSDQINDTEQVPQILKFFSNNESSRYLLTSLELIAFLKDLRFRTGGNIDWRCIIIRNFPDKSGWDFKYIKCYKYKDKWFIKDPNKPKALNYRRVFDPDNISFV